MAETKTFKVGSVQVRIRSEAGLHGNHIRWLNPNETIEVDIDSRTEANNYVWWRHSAGWSAERSLDGKEYYLFPEADEDDNESPIVDTTATTPVVKVFVVGDQQVRVRTRAALSGDMVRWLNPSETKQVTLSSRTESDGYVWWQHDEG